MGLRNLFSGDKEKKSDNDVYKAFDDYSSEELKQDDAKTDNPTNFKFEGMASTSFIQNGSAIVNDNVVMPAFLQLGEINLDDMDKSKQKNVEKDVEDSAPEQACGAEVVTEDQTDEVTIGENAEAVDGGAAEEESPAEEIAVTSEGDTDNVNVDISKQTIEPETADAHASNEDEEASNCEYLKTKLDNLETEIKGLSEQFEEKIKMDEGKNKLINDIYDELESYKEDMHYKQYKPIISDIIDIVYDIHRLIRTYNDKLSKGEEITMKSVINNLEIYESDLTDLLEKYNVESYCYEEVDTFEPRQQKAIKVIPTDDITLDKKIADRLMNGFKTGDKIIVKEKVMAYKYEKPQE